MRMKGKKIGILVEKLYEDQELWYPVFRLREEGATVVLIGPEAGATYPSKHGYPATTDAAAEDVKAEVLDAVIIPGGYAPDHMRRCQPMVKLVADAVAGGKIVAAICHAGWMLCSAGVLRNRSVTSFFAIRDDMVNAGADWTDAAVVRDGNLITSRTPKDLPEFLPAIIDALTQVPAVA